MLARLLFAALALCLIGALPDARAARPPGVAAATRAAAAGVAPAAPERPSPLPLAAPPRR